MTSVDGHVAAVPDTGEIARERGNYFGVVAGVLMLETEFARIPGDVGNAETWPFPVEFKVVKGALPRIVVSKLAESDLLPRFIEAGCEFDRAGIPIITTSCGFLALYQRELQRELRGLVLASSLLQVPWVAGLLPPGQRVGIVTANAAALTPDHLASVGVRADHGVAIQGVDELGGLLLNERPFLDVGRTRAVVVEASRLLLERHPDVGAIVLECTNMPPYAHAVQETTGLPVFDLTTLVEWAAAGMRRRPFQPRYPVR